MGLRSSCAPLRIKKESLHEKFHTYRTCSRFVCVCHFNRSCRSHESSPSAPAFDTECSHESSPSASTVDTECAHQSGPASSDVVGKCAHQPGPASSDVVGKCAQQPGSASSDVVGKCAHQPGPASSAVVKRLDSLYNLLCAWFLGIERISPARWNESVCA